MKQVQNKYEVRTPFEVTINRTKIKIRVESDGRGGCRYCFHDPLKTTAQGNHRRKYVFRQKQDAQMHALHVLQSLVKASNPTPPPVTTL